MKKMILELEVEDYFDPGYCHSCPVSVLDDTDLNYYCSMHYTYDECPLVDKVDYDGDLNK